MSEANRTQVGGNHYRSSYQHWDLVIRHNVPWPQACAVKYLTRWKAKGGQADLLKAEHYVQKAIEEATTVLSMSWLRPSINTLGLYQEVNRIDEESMLPIRQLLSATQVPTLQAALASIRDLIDAAAAD